MQRKLHKDRNMVSFNPHPKQDRHSDAVEDFALQCWREVFNPWDKEGPIVNCRAHCVLGLPQGDRAALGDVWFPDPGTADFPHIHV